MHVAASTRFSAPGWAQCIHSWPRSDSFRRTFPTCPPTPAREVTIDSFHSQTCFTSPDAMDRYHARLEAKGRTAPSLVLSPPWMTFHFTGIGGIAALPRLSCVPYEQPVLPSHRLSLLSSLLLLLATTPHRNRPTWLPPSRSTTGYSPSPPSP